MKAVRICHVSHHESELCLAAHITFSYLLNFFLFFSSLFPNLFCQPSLSFLLLVLSFFFPYSLRSLLFFSPVCFLPYIFTYPPSSSSLLPSFCPSGFTFFFPPFCCSRFLLLLFPFYFFHRPFLLPVFPSFFFSFFHYFPLFFFPFLLSPFTVFPSLSFLSSISSFPLSLPFSFHPYASPSFLLVPSSLPFPFLSFLRVLCISSHTIYPSFLLLHSFFPFPSLPLPFLSFSFLSFASLPFLSFPFPSFLLSSSSCCLCYCCYCCSCCTHSSPDKSPTGRRQVPDKPQIWYPLLLGGQMIRV